MSGFVYNEEGAPITGAVVTIKSLDASVPYTATATTSEGSWVVNNVPEGANVEMIATKDGYTKRRRVGSFQTQSTQKNIVNFGSASSTTGEEGSAYFISDYPEIESTDPKSDATGVDVSKVTYKLRVSEPLTAVSRDNLLKSLRLWPANKAAAGRSTSDAAVTDFETLKDTNDHDGTNGVDLDAGTAGVQNISVSTGNSLTDAIGYVLREGSTFLGSSTNRARGSWNAEGTELTFTFDAALLAAKNEDAKYQIGLVSLGTTKDDKIEDASGKQMGTSAATADLKSYPAANEFIANAFKEVDLASDGGTQSKRWASTHDSIVNFEVKRDETAPKLTGVAVAKNIDSNFRIELTFSEPMAAYNATTRGKAHQETLPLVDANNIISVSATAMDRNADGDTTDAAAAPFLGDFQDTNNVLVNYSFAVGTSTGKTDTVELNGWRTGDKYLDPRLNDTSGNNDDNPETLIDQAEGTAGGFYGTAVAAALVPGNDVWILSGGKFGGKTDHLEKEFSFLPAALARTQTLTGANPGEVVVEVDKDKPATVFLWVKGRPDMFGNNLRELKAYAENVGDPAGNTVTESAAKANQLKGSI